MNKIKKWLAMHFWKFTLVAIVVTLILHFLGVFNAAQAQTPWDERSIPMSFPAVEARDSAKLNNAVISQGFKYYGDTILLKQAFWSIDSLGYLSVGLKNGLGNMHFSRVRDTSKPVDYVGDVINNIYDQYSNDNATQVRYTTRHSRGNPDSLAPLKKGDNLWLFTAHGQTGDTSITSIIDTGFKTGIATIIARTTQDFNVDTAGTKIEFTTTNHNSYQNTKKLTITDSNVSHVAFHAPNLYTQSQIDSLLITPRVQSASLDFANLGISQSEDLNINVSCEEGDAFVVSPPAEISSYPNIQLTYFISAANTVTIRASYVGDNTGGVDMPPLTYTVTVLDNP